MPEAKVTRITVTVEHDGETYTKTMAVRDDALLDGAAAWVRFAGTIAARDVARRLSGPDPGNPRVNITH